MGGCLGFGGGVGSHAEWIQILCSVSTGENLGFATSGPQAAGVTVSMGLRCSQDH